MKGLAATIAFLALTVVAVAKPAPINNLNPTEDLNPTLARSGVDINIGPAGAVIEREYFQAPQWPFTAGGLPCRLQSAIFDKVYLAQLCH